MRPSAIFSAYLLALLVLSSHPAAAGQCGDEEAALPVQFKFEDIDARQDWVYRSLDPRLELSGSLLTPQRTDIDDGTLHLIFCIPIKMANHRSRLRIGPRAYSISPRQELDHQVSIESLPRVYLLRQENPDWVILKSYIRLQPAGSNLPVFDLELFNFGKPHPGGQVDLRIFESGSNCITASRAFRVLVEVSLSENKLTVSSGDPEFPEEQIQRQAKLVTGTCGDNYSFSMDLGVTGPLENGPFRIRYVVREAKYVGLDHDRDRPMLGREDDGGSRLRSDLLSYFRGLRVRSNLPSYFRGRRVEMKVSGDGIWPQEPHNPYLQRTRRP